MPVPHMPAAAAAVFLGPTVRVTAPQGRAHIAAPWEAPALVMQGVPPEWAALAATGEGAVAPWSVVMRLADIPDDADPPCPGAWIDIDAPEYPRALQVSSVVHNGGLVHLACYERTR